MALIIELVTFFIAAFAVGMIYNLGVKRRPMGAALHLSAVFGMAVMLVMFLVGLVNGFLS